MKRVTSLALCLMLALSLFSGCSIRFKAPDDSAPTSETALPGETPGGAQAGGDAATHTAESSPEASESELVRAVVFEYAFEEAADPNDFNSASTKYSSRMTLYETSPGVFEGEEIAVSTIEGGSESTTNEALSFETSFLHFRTGHIILPVDTKTAVKYLFWSENTLFDHEYKTYYNSAELGDEIMSFYRVEFFDDEMTLVVDGNRATLYSGTEDYPPMESEIVMLPLPAKPDFAAILMGKTISINNSYWDSEDERNIEYRCILTASPENGGYSGDLFFYSDGKVVQRIDGNVNFEMQPYDRAAYLKAGGTVPVTFDAMGVIHTSNDDFIVLLDGDRPLIEHVGSKSIFYGYLIPETEIAEAKRVAENTKSLACALYDRIDYKNPSASYMIYGKPEWYPGEFMPKPIRALAWKFSELTKGYNLYYAYYQESNIDTYEVYKNYLDQLKGADSLFAAFDEGSYTGVLRYKVGVYAISITIRPPFNVPDPFVNVRISG